MSPDESGPESPDESAPESPDESQDESPATAEPRYAVLSQYGFALIVGVSTLLLALIGVVALELPIRDPDGLAGPAWVRLPGIIAALFLIDALPRTWARRSRTGSSRAALKEVINERWSPAQIGVIALGLGAFYASYVGYRNIKNFLPFIHETTVDDALLVLDHALLLGHNPAEVLHQLLGTTVAAHALSMVYLAFLVFVPLSLGAALVWGQASGIGPKYVSALCLNWSIGALSYHLLPSLGPIYAKREMFNSLATTGVSQLQESLLRTRISVLLDPWATQSLHGIGAFPSLHTSVVFTAAYLAHRVGAPRWARRALWIFFALTVISTIYFGWHYLLDDIGGVGLGLASVRIAEKLTGNSGSQTATKSAGGARHVNG